MIFTLLFPTFTVVSDFSRFHSEVCHLKEVLRKNAFPIKLKVRCIKKIFNERLTEKPLILTAEEKNLVIVLPFLRKVSLDLRIRLKNNINKNLPKSISKFFLFFSFRCSRCNATYYGKTCRRLSVRVGKHSDVLP